MRCRYCHGRIPAEVIANAHRRHEEPKYCSKRHGFLYWQRRDRFVKQGLEGAELDRALRRKPKLRDPHKARTTAAKAPKPAKLAETATERGAQRPVSAVEPTSTPPDSSNARARILAELDALTAQGSEDNAEDDRMTAP